MEMKKLLYNQMSSEKRIYILNAMLNQPFFLITGKKKFQEPEKKKNQEIGKYQLKRCQKNVRGRMVVGLYINVLDNVKIKTK